MDVLERRALRIILGLDKGNDQLLYGEVDIDKVSVEAEKWAVRYGEKVEGLQEEDVRRMMLMERMGSASDRWRKYVERIEESLEGIELWDEQGLERGVGLRVSDREDNRWREAMDKSKSSL